MQRQLALLLAAALLAGCATTTRTPRPGETPAAEPAKPAVVPMLAHEQRWLDQWFSGTPVVIAPADDGALEVEVPLKFSFDAGRSAVKAPLAAVLDKVSESLRRQVAARIQVAAPPDASGGSAIARERGASVRDYLVAKGVQHRRITRLAVHESAVELRLLPPPSAIERLEDEPPSAGKRVTPRPVR